MIVNDLFRLEQKVKRLSKLMLIKKMEKILVKLLMFFIKLSNKNFGKKNRKRNLNFLCPIYWDYGRIFAKTESIFNILYTEIYTFYLFDHIQISYHAYQFNLIEYESQFKLVSLLYKVLIHH